MTSGVAFAAINIPFTINLSEAVTVTGTPRIAVDVGGNTRYATYTSGTGTNALTFTLSPTIGDVDLDGVTVSSPIDLNGGTIKDTAGNDANLTFTPPNTTGIKINYPSLGMDFTNGATGRYTLNGTVYNNLSSFLTASGGTFARNSIGTYFDSTGTLRTAAANAPRFDYDPVTHAAKGILIEEQRTNEIRYSASPNTTNCLSTGVTTTQGSIFNLDGSLATRMTESNSLSQHNIECPSIGTGSNTTNIFSVYVKDDGRQFIMIHFTGAATRGVVVVDLTSQQTNKYEANVTISNINLYPLSNGWHRLSFSIFSDRTILSPNAKNE